ncbi:MAG: hypothetical protein ABI759_20585, partial [Candidatus Solibacter sp.]
MDFTQKYQLIELLPGEGVESYRARQTNTGRDVTVHLLVGGKTPSNEAVLVRLRAMLPQSMAKLIEVGEHQGNTFVVTVAPPYLRLDEWLAEQDKAAAVAKEFGKAGFWKRPETAPAPPKPAPPPPPPPAAGKDEPGEFTRQFKGSVVPAPEPGMPSISPLTGQFKGTGPVAPPPQAPLDDFDKLFGAPAPEPDPVLTQPKAQLPVAPPSAPPLSPPKSEPGEFTRMFQGMTPEPAAAAVPPAKPPAPVLPAQSPAVVQPAQPPAPPPASVPPAADPGAFTRMFQNPTGAGEVTERLPIPGPLNPPPSPIRKGEPGEFTRMFQNVTPAAPAARPAEPPPPASKPPASEPGEFTQMF